MIITSDSFNDKNELYLLKVLESLGDPFLTEHCKRFVRLKQTGCIFSASVNFIDNRKIFE